MEIKLCRKNGVLLKVKLGSCVIFWFFFYLLCFSWFILWQSSIIFSLRSGRGVVAGIGREVIKLYFFTLFVFRYYKEVHSFHNYRTLLIMSKSLNRIDQLSSGVLFRFNLFDVFENKYNIMSYICILILWNIYTISMHGENTYI